MLVGGHFARKFPFHDSNGWSRSMRLIEGNQAQTSCFKELRPNLRAVTVFLPLRLVGCK